MVTQSEAALKESLIEKLVDGGYERVKIVAEDGLKHKLKSQIENFNNIELSDDEFKKILLYLENGTIFDKAKKLRDKYALKREDEVLYLGFFNSKDWCKNIFQVTNQVTMKKTYENRYDVTILINGLPLVQIELKKRGAELKVAFNQINRYCHHFYRGFFQYIQIFVISNGVNTKYFANNKDLSLNTPFSGRIRKIIIFLFWMNLQILCFSYELKRGNCICQSLNQTGVNLEQNLAKILKKTLNGCVTCYFA